MNKPYHPPHFYKENTDYFITAHTFDKRRFFTTETEKEMLLKVLYSAANVHSIFIHTWVILDNHYHLLIKINTTEKLVKFIKSLHGKSAIELNKINSTPGQKIWVNYWDHCIRSKKDFWVHFNYIHNNPLKHGYVKNFNKLIDYKFSGYSQWVEEKGVDWLKDIWETYPVVDFEKE